MQIWVYTAGSSVFVLTYNNSVDPDVNTWTRQTDLVLPMLRNAKPCVLVRALAYFIMEYSDSTCLHIILYSDYDVNNGSF